MLLTKLAVNRRAAAAVAICAIAYALVCTKTVLEARQIRRGRYGSCPSFLSNDAVHGVIGRYILLRPGADAYNREVVSCFGSASLLDTPWNRRALGHFAAQIDRDLLDAWLDTYPLAASAELEPRLVSMLDNGTAAVLPVLARTASGREVIARWRETQFLNDRASAILALPYLLKIDAASLRSALADLRLTNDEFGQFLSDNIQRGQAAPLLGFVTDEISARRLTLASVLPSFHHFLDHQATAQQATRLLMTWGPALNSASWIAALGISGLDANVDSVPGVIVPDDTESLFAEALSHVPASEPEAAVLFHSLAHMAPVRASALAENYCKAEDSPLTKAVAVLAERHELSTRCLDRAFSGTVPRTVLFASYYQYFAGSKASEEYALLAGHSMEEVGKRWPPHYGTRRPDPSDPERWRQFIDAYPWFPALDDAYYRLVYAMLMNGQYQEIVAVANTMATVKLLDDDSLPYIEHTALVAAVESGVADGDVLGSVEALHRDDWRDFGRELDDLIELVDWLIRSQERLDGQTPPLDDLLQARAALEVQRVRCLESEECKVPPQLLYLQNLPIEKPKWLRRDKPDPQPK